MTDNIQNTTLIEQAANPAYKTVALWENGAWSEMIFQTRNDFKLFVLTLFKEPGQYDFDETSFMFNEQARIYNKQKFYLAAPRGSKDFRTYWDDQKHKCRNGAIFRNKGKTWYLTREYYMWLNFLPINDKEQKKFDFPSVRDAQYHMALYEMLAELHYKHCAILKKRQIASSYFHAGKLVNQLWFEETCTLKMGASLKDYVNEKGTWKFINEYKSFLDQHTAWYRPMNPYKAGLWQQQIEETVGNRKHFRGLKGTLQSISFDQKDTSGVGGPCTIFFYEEAGIAPTMDSTVEFLLPALQSGNITTGIFIAAGSVGDLDQCEPLKQMILNPNGDNIYEVETNLIDEKGTIGKTGLFIPEQWSMPPYIDRYGNSIINEPTAEQIAFVKEQMTKMGEDISQMDPSWGALRALQELRKVWKKTLTPEKYQIRVSQRPTNIAEAFAYRKVSVFPQHLVSMQKQKIQDKEYPYELLELSRNHEGKIIAKESNKIPINEWPIKKNDIDKEGCLVVVERPVKDPEFGMYYGSIDPVSEGKTTTSDSLCTIYIYKTAVEVTKINGDQTETHIEGDKIVAYWCGRFDDINKTHERLEMIIEWYNAWTIIENNISLFISHMINKKKQRYMVPKSQILFLKELEANKNVYQEYGWKNVGTIFKNHLLSYLIEFLKEHINEETKEDGTIVKITYGIERIPDLMAMVEMEGYDDGVNVDRLVALAALVAFAKVQQANRGYKKRVIHVDNKHLEKSKEMYKLHTSPFKNIGGSNRTGKNNKGPSRNPYKNLR